MEEENINENETIAGDQLPFTKNAVPPSEIFENNLEKSNPRHNKRRSLSRKILKFFGLSPRMLKTQLASIGWLSFSIIFNILNTICFSALYPKILQQITPDKASYSSSFSMINSITTIIAAIVLPPLGSLLDKLSLIKHMMIFSLYTGIICTLLLFPLDLIPKNMRQVHLYINEALYVFGMFFLRVAVMNNNALLPNFPKKQMVGLSLNGNLLGFACNLVGLFIMVNYPTRFFFKNHFLGFTQANWWLIIFTTLVLIFAPLTFFAPSGSSKKKKQKKQSKSGDKTGENAGKEEEEEYEYSIIIRAPYVLFQTLKSIFETIVWGFYKENYLKTWIFLFSYLFFSIAGTVITIFLATFFIDLYDMSLQDEVTLNLYYKVLMVIGVFSGSYFDKFNRKFLKLNDIVLLVIQNVLFNAVIAIMYFLILIFPPNPKFKYNISFFHLISVIFGPLMGGEWCKEDLSLLLVLIFCCLTGFLYSWNTSVARGLMSKLLPKEKSGEFMGWYSTFTYLGISVISFVYSWLRKLGLPSESLLVLIFLWILPGYLFLAILWMLQAKDSWIVVKISKILGLEKLKAAILEKIGIKKSGEDANLLTPEQQAEKEQEEYEKAVFGKSKDKKSRELPTTPTPAGETMQNENEANEKHHSINQE